MAVRRFSGGGAAATAFLLLILILILILILLPGAAGAQVPQPAPGGAPLREEPGDWWGDVHRWTGSDATRPRRSAEPAAGGGGPPRRAAGGGPTRGGAGGAAPPQEAAGRVTTSATSRANIRREPSTGAPVQRVVRPGTSLRVFAEAPGGWLQVGEADEPIGWIHQSALQGR